jgi:hypothetical protein
MRRALGPFLVCLLLGGALVIRLTEDAWLTWTGGLMMVGAVTVMYLKFPAARRELAAGMPRAAWLGRRTIALRWRTIGLVVAGCVAAFVAAEVGERQAFRHSELADHLRATYGPDLHDDRPPLVVSAELDGTWPADDQRYTAVGVLLRYEHDIVALLPDGDGGTTIERERDDVGYRRFYTYVGDFWGDSYHAREDLPRSAMAVPDERDVRAVTRRLARAVRAQGVCFTWNVDIRSGRRAGAFTGPVSPRGCPYVRLVGWIDPNAGRLTSKGTPGDWSLVYEWNIDGDITQASIDAIDTPLIELVEGATQQYGGGSRAGKGLLEHIDAMPLLAQDVPGIPRVLPGTAFGVPPDARPAAAKRTDSKRRAEESWVGVVVAFVQIGAGFTIFFVFAGLIAAVIVRAVRRVRA